MDFDEYHAYLESEGWRKRRAACLRAAGYRCVVCNSEGRLQAHHRTYERLGRELPGDLTCLCDDCHGLYAEHVKGPWEDAVLVERAGEVAEAERGWGAGEVAAAFVVVLAVILWLMSR